MKKIIFLDIDGVFNCNEYYKKRHAENENWQDGYPLCEFCPDRVKLFNQIIEATNAEIVVSSTWRADGVESLTNLFNQLGIKGTIIDVTPHFRSDESVRGNEIEWWIKNNLKYLCSAKPSLHKEYEILKEDGSFKMMSLCELGIDYQYVIIDDDNDMLLCQKDNFIQTSWESGLEQHHVNKAIQILNNEKTS